MHVRPSIRLVALPKSLPLAQRLRIARDAGFEGIEVEHGQEPAEALRDAADAANLVVHSVHASANYVLPLTSGDPKIRDAGIATTLAALETARIVGADTLLLIPGVVDDETSYAQVFDRSLDVIGRDILPTAERLNIVLAIENVTTGFLLSPFDCLRYIESFDSPFVRLYLDVGNIICGRPEGWIDIAAPTIIKLHLKDCRRVSMGHGRFEFARVGEGDIDWPKVCAALEAADFRGWGVMADAENIQPRHRQRLFHRTRQLAGKFGWNPALRLIEGSLSRSLVDDSMRRFRRYIVPATEPSAARGSIG